jgi:hypothetical protein
LALVAISAGGLIAIVGSGGGALGLPSDCPPGMNCNAPPPAAGAEVRPAYVTALVGTPVTYSAETVNTTGTVTYQWSRSTDGGASYADIAGATFKTYMLAGVNLGDDGSVFRVVVKAGNATLSATGRLVVSATPGVVFEDGEFQDADWLVRPFGDANEPAPVQSAQRVATGGNPDAYRQMTIQLPAHALAGRVFYTSLAATYDPRVQGAIRAIDYAEDGISLTPNTSTFTESALLLEQSGRTYIGNQRPRSDVLPSTWSPIASQSSLLATDFGLLDGPACAAGESCPDFSASAAPMRFGYWRISFGIQGDTIVHGIDNWKVTVWR